MQITSRLRITSRVWRVGLFTGLLLVLAIISGLVFPRPALAAGTWEGQIATDVANVRAAPSGSAPVVGTLKRGQKVGVVEWVLGDKVVGKNDVWGRIGDGQYVYSGMLAKATSAPPPPPATAPTSGRWIDVNLTQQVATAYEGRKPVYTAVVSTGTVGWGTPRGTFPVQRRVASTTMDSSSLAVSVSEPYRIPDVKWVQYLTKWGHAIHSNYWKWDSPFGVPTSHGCIGMKEADAAFFWSFATLGTPVVIHD